MLLYFVMISEVTKEIYAQPTLDVVQTDLNGMVRYMFFTLEFLVFVMILLGNLLFLSVRMLAPNQVNIVRIEDRRRMACTDTAEALALLQAQYQVFVVPFLTTACLVQIALSAGMSADSIKHTVNFTYFMAAQSAVLHFLIFVSWKKGPKCWLIIAPKLYLGLLVITYVLMPCGMTFYMH